MQRRSFLGSVLGFIVAPAVVKAESLMPIVVPKFKLFDDRVIFLPAEAYDATGRILTRDDPGFDPLWEDPPLVTLRHEAWVWTEGFGLFIYSSRVQDPEPEVYQEDILGVMLRHRNEVMRNRTADVFANEMKKNAEDDLKRALRESSPDTSWRARHQTDTHIYGPGYVGNLKALELPMFKDFV